MQMGERTNPDSDLTAGKAAEIAGGRLFGRSESLITDLHIDSRAATGESGSVFFATKGPNHDGHSFIPQVYRRGVRTFIVEKIPEDCSGYHDASFIEVPGTIRALQNLAAYKRSRFHGEVIAVTGSAGKTIVKEWLSEILSHRKRVVRSPKSYNSQSGVPLSVWKLSDEYDVGIFEAGVSRPGEMIMLEPVIRPSMGIFTNIGDAHQENFADITTKVREKLLLFSHVKRLVYPLDNEVIQREVINFFGKGSHVPAGWSFVDSQAPFFIEILSSENEKTTISVSWSGNSDSYSIPFSDRASIENSVSVAVAALVSGVSSDVLSGAMPFLNPVAMRMAVRNGINNCVLIEDYYNSDPGSLSMAIDYLRSQQGRSHTLILSDFLQTGRDQRELALEVSKMVVRGMITRFIGIGESLLVNKEYFGEQSLFFKSTEEFIESFGDLSFRNEAILLKGARVFQFELIANLLEQKSHTTVLEVNLDAIVRNLNQFRSLINPGVRIMAMVKAFAYGSGGAAIGSLLEFNRVDYLGVAYADEGVDLRESGVTIPVMIMNPDPDSFGTIVRYNLEPEIYSMRLLSEFSMFASRHGLIGYPVHIKVDTGMHRLGFLPHEVPSMIKKVKSSGSMKVISVFSHLSASESPEHDHFTHRQASIFEAVCKTIAEGIGYMPVRHLLNSAGITRFSEYQYDMVRPGLGLYGLTMAGGISLSQVSRYISRISQIKEVKAGEPVGYGYTAISDKNRTIAIVPVGYADGLNRRLGNGVGSVFIAGKRAPVTGNVCMDMCMADITGIPAQEGDLVEIFGENLSIMEMAKVCDTIPYEIITSIPPRVRRIFYHE